MEKENLVDSRITASTTDHNNLEASAMRNRIYLLERERSNLIKSRDVLTENFTRLATLCKYEITKMLDQVSAKNGPNSSISLNTVHSEPVFLDPCVPKISFSTLLKYLYTNNQRSTPTSAPDTSVTQSKLSLSPNPGASPLDAGLILAHETVASPAIAPSIEGHNKGHRDGSSSSSLSSSSESDSSSSVSSMSNVVKKPATGNELNCAKRRSPLKERPVTNRFSPKEHQTQNHSSSQRSKERSDDPPPSNINRKRSDNRQVEPSRKILDSLKRKAEANVFQNRRDEAFKRSSSRRGRHISDEERRRLDRKYERMEEDAVRNHDRLKMKKSKVNEAPSNPTMFSRRMSERSSSHVSTRTPSKDPKPHKEGSASKDNQSLVCDVLQALVADNHSHETATSDHKRNLDLDEIYNEDPPPPNEEESGGDHQPMSGDDNLDKNSLIEVELSANPQSLEAAKDPDSANQTSQDPSNPLDNMNQSSSLDKTSCFEPINQSEDEIEEGEAISDEEEETKESNHDRDSSANEGRYTETRERCTYDPYRRHNNVKSRSSTYFDRNSRQRSVSPPRHHHRFRSPRSPSHDLHRKRIRRYSPHFNRDLPDHLRKRLSTPGRKMNNNPRFSRRYRR